MPPPINPSLPPAGWACVAVSDLRTRAFICEACGTESVRYVHTLTHRDRPEPLHAGLECVARLVAGYDAGAAERDLRNRGRRFEAFCADWRPTKRGNLCRRKGGVLCLIGRDPDGQYWARVGEQDMPGRFATGEEALRAAFDAVDPVVSVTYYRTEDAG